jgi:8-oxo-dGTP diphosphatase
MSALHEVRDPRYPALGVAVDVVVFTVRDGHLEVLLTRRPDEEPFPRAWSLPGGFVQPTESADDAAARELAAKAGVQGVFLEQLYTFTDPDRDPRSRVVAVTYYALVSPERVGPQPGRREAQWFRIGTVGEGRVQVDLPSAPPRRLAFDHERILQTAVDRIRGKLEYVPIGFQLLEPHFTLTELQTVYEAVLGHPVDKRNFRAKIQKSGLVREVDAVKKGAHRPAKLFEFTQRTF